MFSSNNDKNIDKDKDKHLDKDNDKYRDKDINKDLLHNPKDRKAEAEMQKGSSLGGSSVNQGFDRNSLNRGFSYDSKFMTENYLKNLATGISGTSSVTQGFNQEKKDQLKTEMPGSQILQRDHPSHF